MGLLQTEAGGNLEFNELGNAFGQVTVVGTVKIFYRTMSATSIWVESIDTSGEFDDVYDFDYLVGGRSITAVQVQAGHATLGALGDRAGKVFFTRLEFATGTKVHQQTYSPSP